MNILYISYDGALDPLGSSQVVPYLIGLSKKGFRFTLLTYEKKKRLKDPEKLAKLQNSLKDNGINWKFLKYHKSPSVPATAFDILMGFILGILIVSKKKINFIHARSFVGAVPGIFLAKLFGLKFIFDMRGFWADERAEGGIWKHKGLLYKAAKWWEKFFILNSDWVICLTEEAKRIINNFNYLQGKRICIGVIPTCVDTSKFNIGTKNRSLIRENDLKNRFVFVYLGSIGTWYLLDEMVDFFLAAKKIKPSSFFMFLTLEEKIVQQKINRANISKNDYLINYLPYEEINSWVSLADASISFIKPLYSKKSSCPTKFAESLACGLPVVINSGIGDTEELVRDYNLGVVVDDFTENSYVSSVRKLFSMFDEEDKLRYSCRKAAEDFFSLESGVEKYQDIYKKV